MCRVGKNNGFVAWLKCVAWQWVDNDQRVLTILQHDLTEAKMGDDNQQQKEYQCFGVHRLSLIC